MHLTLSVSHHQVLENRDITIWHIPDCVNFLFITTYAVDFHNRLRTSRLKMIHSVQRFLNCLQLLERELDNTFRVGFLSYFEKGVLMIACLLTTCTKIIV